MLVLSRGTNDRVVFPSLGITVDILRIDGNKVRLGIEAPRDIPIHRQEIADRIRQSGQDLAPPQPAESKFNHQIRNRLNTASLGLHLLHRKLEAGATADAEGEVFRILNELKAIETHVQGRENYREHSAEPDGYHALVVEDDANERELLAGYLQMSGFQVDTAMDGMQAMVKLTKPERPDVVLLDMKMPRFDGVKTISAIRSNPDYRDVKVFGVSGEDRNRLNISIGREGVDRWFSKPLDPRELVSAIRAELTPAFASA